jgi:hypothetical protein
MTLDIEPIPQNYNSDFYDEKTGKSIVLDQEERNFISNLAD